MAFAQGKRSSADNALAGHDEIAKGGEDAALFGYTAKLLNRAPALRKVRFAQPAAGA